VQGLHDVAQLILQILSNPAWSGVSSICALIGIPLAILLARQSHAHKLKIPSPITREIRSHSATVIKKKSLNVRFDGLVAEPAHRGPQQLALEDYERNLGVQP